MSGLENELAALIDMDQVTLRKHWRHHYGSDAPDTMSRELLLRAVGYKIQERELGGLNRRVELRLAALQSNSGGSKGNALLRTATALKSGTKLLREWQGKVHEVLALDDGRFAHRGKTYQSLTTIAREITGTHQSGPRFFGLKPHQNASHG
jgi:Protein of unknown function (DUF2924)